MVSNGGHIFQVQRDLDEHAVFCTVVGILQCLQFRETGRPKKGIPFRSRAPKEHELLHRRIRLDRILDRLPLGQIGVLI